MMAVCVDPKRINEVWPHAKGFIEKAYALGIGDDTFEIVAQDVLAGHSLLWLASEDNKIFGAALSKLWKSPRWKICSVLAVGGDELPLWKDCLRAIEQYAKEEGCQIVRLSGRDGWQRIFKDYEQPWITLEKRI